MNHNAKVWWKSRTLAFNALAGAAAIMPQLEASLPMLHAVLPADYYAKLSGVVVVGNVILRVITSTRLALKPREALP